ncbi:DUF1205 domain-containing protein [Actinomadura barringtoniae]|uniref:DUF1205 domain-containing protein n=1 Tax=Actinomadura barringtoniae TaxID=1427535 RepID=A0A939T1X3_9ACTN|nr:nucleotide disphospho-sugar-binding domain-containing protein [Actinomadura barringtoniae]MBO2445568.1 DUF1205 domain-containing protein [Actinomadura barringtoniae]
MRIIIATWAHRSHYFPLVPLGWALMAAGHDVRVAAQPDGAQVVADSGIPFAAVGPRLDLDEIMPRLRVAAAPEATAAEREVARQETAVRMFMEGSRVMAGGMAELARSYRPDAIVYEPRIYAALKAANDLGVPAIRSLSGGTDYTCVREEIERPYLAPLWEEFGLEGVSPHGDMTIDPCPPSLQVDGDLPRRFMRYIPYNGGGSTQKWVNEPVERPRVVVTWGVTHAKRTGHLNPVKTVVEALADMDVDVIVAQFKQEAKLLGELPPHARLIESMPLQLLLPTCSAIVHQGGAGTMMTSASCGVPQLILHSIQDQPHNAEQLAEQGAGLGLDLAEADRDSIREHVDALLHDVRHRSAAEALKNEIERQPEPSSVVGQIEDLQARSSGRPASV